MNSNETRKRILDLLYDTRNQGLPSYLGVAKIMSELNLSKDDCYFHLEFLKSKGYIDPLQSVGEPYVSAKITALGMDVVEGGTFQPIIKQTIETTDIKEVFINVDFNEFFYDKLKEEINFCLNHELFTSVFILSRKLIENLVIDVLRTKFPPSDTTINLYFDTRNGRFLDFSILLKNLEEKKEEFSIDKDSIERFLSLVKPFRPRANSNAHSIETLADRKDVERFKIPEMTALLFRIFGKMST